MNRILIADDSTLGRKMIKLALGKTSLAGAEILDAENGQEALQHVRQGNVDLVFIDLYMPVMNGLEFIREVRGEGIDVPVLVITAETSPALVEELHGAGATVILGKPLPAGKLKEALDDIGVST